MSDQFRLIKALLREPVDRTPIWFMRQAGRYLPEYRETREKAGSFMQLCQTPELACEVTLQPLERYPLDAAILFSDILTIPDAMGLGLSFAQGEGPQFAKPVRTAADIKNLSLPDPNDDLRYVMDAIRLIKQSLGNRAPLIGFAGSPWTVATYMVEGKSSKQFNTIRAMMYREPQLLHQLLKHVAKATAQYLQAQIEAGVDVVMLFDSWGGMLGAKTYGEFSLDYMQAVLKALPSSYEGHRIPKILFTKGGNAWLEAIAQTDCDAVGIDWGINIADAKRRIGAKKALQGNLDPAALYATPERVSALTQAVLDDFGDGPGHVFNLGHGIYPDTDPEAVAAMVETVVKSKENSFSL